MKHKLIGHKNLTHPYLLLEIELIPDNDVETQAIKKVEVMDANDTQKEMIENYLLFGLKMPYAIHSVERQNNTRFVLKASIN